MPSKATSQPAAFTGARSGESSRSSGLVLFRWMKIRRCARQAVQAGEAPVRTAHRHVGHVLRALRAEPERGKLVARPEGPVEEHAVGGLERAADRVASPRRPPRGRPGPGRSTASRIRNPMLSSGSGVAPASRWIGGLPGTATASTRRPDAPAIEVGQFFLFAEPERAPGDLAGKAIERPVQHVAVRESTANAVGRVDDERMRFAQGQEAQAMIEIAVRQQDRGDRRVTGAARVERRDSSRSAGGSPASSSAGTIDRRRR